MADSPALILRRVVDKSPLHCPQGNCWLHAVGVIDKMVLDGQIREIIELSEEKITGKNRQISAVSQAIIIGTLQLSMRVSEDPKSERVFPDFDDAYVTFRDQPDAASSIYTLYQERFELTDAEKKI